MKQRTIRLEAAPDLNHLCRGDGVLFVRDGIGIAGRGVAATCDATEVAATLSSIVDVSPVIDVRSGAGAVALGLVPFLPGGASSFVVPEFVIAKHTDGTATATIVAGDEAHAGLCPRCVAAVSAPAGAGA